MSYRPDTPSPAPTPGVRGRGGINTIEPMWWALFGAGGFVVALVLPVLIVFFGWSIPLGGILQEAVAPARMHNLVTNPLVRLFLLVVVSLTLFHWAHRFRYLVFDLGIRGGRMPIAVLTYGAAIVGTAWAVWVLATL